MSTNFKIGDIVIAVSVIDSYFSHIGLKLGRKGTVVKVHWSTTYPLLVDFEKPIGLVGVDLSEVKKLNTAFSMAKRHQESLDSSK